MLSRYDPDNRRSTRQRTCFHFYYVAVTVHQRKVGRLHIEHIRSRQAVIVIHDGTALIRQAGVCAVKSVVHVPQLLRLMLAVPACLRKINHDARVTPSASAMSMANRPGTWELKMLLGVQRAYCTVQPMA